ncbi:MAG: hypothetical protein LC804_09235 [Acidobacteria bacterium]|nr:hypothetical protein [Acidobacteriota bacterium]
MNTGALRALEFDRIVEAVRRFAQTPQGAVRLAALQPSVGVQAVAALLDATSETVRFLAENQVGLQAPAELETILTGLGVEGRALEPLHLTALAVFVASVEATCAAVRRGRATFPILRAIADTTASFDDEIADIRRKIEPSGEVVDDASPELRSVRERLRKQRTRLRGTLESYLRGKDTAKYLQQQIVTDRNGRYVLTVRSEHRSAIPGIVHGSSGSGASLFLEPLSTVEINNDIVALEQQEAEEIRRILVALSDAFRRRAEDLQRTVEAATDLDVLQARARFSIMIDGTSPAIATDGRLELRGARHPLLIPAVRRHLGTVTGAADADVEKVAAAAAQDRAPVPVDVLIIPPVQVLVITGPNTGGKTVALKTAGLLGLMAQAGLLIPVAGGSQITVFQSVFAAIGDEQSISASLSTFSGHIANVVLMERSLELPALVLLDEAGAGTDPVEGGRRRGLDSIHRHSRPRTGSTTGRPAAASLSRLRRGWACRRPSSNRRGHIAASGRRNWRTISRRSSATCRRWNTNTAWPPASGKLWLKPAPSCRRVSTISATARTPSAESSTSASKNGCVRLGGRSTRSSRS